MEPKDTQAVNKERRGLIVWLWRLPVIAALGGMVYAAYELYRLLFRRVRPAVEPRFNSQKPERIAALKDLAELWDSVEFVFANEPVLVMQIPEPIAGSLSHNTKHYAAFSRVCTHQGCIVQLSRNPEAIAVAYNYRIANPALVCKCHFSVFDPLRDGEAVSGPASLPLPRIQLQVREDSIYALGIEEV